MLLPSTITARRTRRYTSTLYIHRTIHGVGYNPYGWRRTVQFTTAVCQRLPARTGQFTSAAYRLKPRFYISYRLGTKICVQISHSRPQSRICKQPPCSLPGIRRHKGRYVKYPPSRPDGRLPERLDIPRRERRAGKRLAGNARFPAPGIVFPYFWWSTGAVLGHFASATRVFSRKCLCDMPPDLSCTTWPGVEDAPPLAAIHPRGLRPLAPRGQDANRRSTGDSVKIQTQLPSLLEEVAQ